MSEEKKITLSGEEYKAIIDELGALKKQVGVLENKNVVSLDEDTSRIAFLRKVDEKYVIATSSARIKKGEDPTFGKMEIDLTLKDGEKEEKKTVDYLDFIRNADKVKVTILETKLIDRGIKEYGEVEVREVKEYKTVGTGLVVPLRSVNPIYESMVETPEGDKITVNNRFLNI